jgi:hypothetical protein
MITHRGRQLALVFAVAGAMGVSFGCATVDTAIVAQPGAEFSLPLGKTASLSGNGVTVTFTQVQEDSRCPIDVVCVWAGDAKIELAIKHDGSPEEVRVVSLTPTNNETTSGDVRIRFVGLAPAPRQADAGKPRAYVARLVLSRT